jgi:hypothetical protein
MIIGFTRANDAPPTSIVVVVHSSSSPLGIVACYEAPPPRGASKKLSLLQAERGFAAYVFRRVVVRTGSCFGHAGMVHRGGEQLSYGIACSIAIPPLAVGRSVSLINEL